MVLICNNNVLTIEQFHKNRCAEKNEIKDIIINRKYLKEKYKETPYITPEPNTTYIKSIEKFLKNNEIKQNKSIYLNTNKK